MTPFLSDMKTFLRGGRSERSCQPTLGSGFATMKVVLKEAPLPIPITKGGPRGARPEKIGSGPSRL